MKHIIRKAFWDYEKEEKWINEMASKGLVFENYSWLKYEFEEAPAGEYIYRIIFLENPVDHPESKKYIEFLEETGAEYVSHYMKWVYFRKKATDGAFKIYSDIDSKLKHYKRVNLYWLAFAALELTAGFINVFMSTLYYNVEGLSSGLSSINYIIGTPLIVLGILFLFISAPVRRKIKHLEREKTIRE